MTRNSNPGDQVTYSCSVTGSRANDTFVYGWLLNGAPLERKIKSSLTVTASEDSAGNYECTVRNAFGEFGQSSVARLILSKNITNLIL